MRSRLRFVGIGLTLIPLVFGLWAALRLIGWPLALPTIYLGPAHGALMVDGVLASLIGVERAVALERRAFYISPVLTGAGALVLAWTGDVAVAFGTVTAGAVVLLVMFLVILRRQPGLHTVGQAIGAACLVVGNMLGGWGHAVPELVPWWGSFLALVIAAERLELSRLLRLTALDTTTFAISVGLTVSGCIVATWTLTSGFVLAAGGWFLLAAWLLVHDIAYRNAARRGLPRFTAFCLLTGYGWLLVSAALIYFEGGLRLGLTYDAALHGVFLGFVLSMVFAHAPVILPSVLGRPLRFHPILYAPLLLLHASLAVRIGSDLLAAPQVRSWAGLANVAAIVAFGVALVTLLQGQQASAGRSALLRPAIREE